jgi:NitT/TauT family transport system permease protein
MKNKILNIILPILTFASLVGIWNLLLRIGALNKALFPYPSEVLNAVFDNHFIIEHIFTSLKSLFICVCIGYTIGFVVGFVLSFNKKINFIEDFLSFFMSIPGISWAPLFIITIGFGNPTILAVGSLTAFFPVVYNVYHGLKVVNKSFHYLGDIMEYSVLEKVFRIHLPAIMNYIIIALKLSLARTWRTVIAVEMVAGSMFGLGFMIFDAREFLNVDVMFAGIFLSGLIYVMIELIIIKVLERMTVIKWGMKS